jgi:hypothetical protein
LHLSFFSLSTSNTLSRTLLSPWANEFAGELSGVIERSLEPNSLACCLSYTHVVRKPAIESKISVPILKKFTGGIACAVVHLCRCLYFIARYSLIGKEVRRKLYQSHCFSQCGRRTTTMNLCGLLICDQRPSSPSRLGASVHD